MDDPRHGLVGFDPSAESKGLAFRWEVAHDADRRFAGDTVRLTQVLSNLLHNAIRYTPQGAVTLRCHEPPDGSLRLGVSDTGIGIPGEQVQTIFEDFCRLEDARRIHREGFGLGLGIVRRLSGLLGLPVDVESGVGRGSTFGVSIPPAKVHRLA